MRATSKKKVLLVLALALTVIIVILVMGQFGKETTVNNNLSVIEPNQQAIETKDSDNDGLVDWEEALWNTDPQNPDTDGDGTPDGEEVSAGTNPLKSGPNDLIGEAEKVIVPDLNPTQEISREFFADYLKLKQSGEYNEQTAAQLVAELTEKSYSSLSNRELTIADLQIIPTNSKNIRDFANDLVAMFANNAHQSAENEFEIFVQWLETQNDSVLTKLDPILNSYKGMASDAPSIAVPSDYANAFVALINSFEKLSSIVGAMKNAGTDLIPALPALDGYESAVLAMINNTQTIVWMIQDSGTQFTPTDIAYPLTQIN